MEKKWKLLYYNRVDIGVMLSSVFWWLNLVRLYPVYKIVYPKRRIQSCSLLGTIVSPNKKKKKTTHLGWVYQGFQACTPVVVPPGFWGPFKGL